MSNYCGIPTCYWDQPHSHYPEARIYRGETVFPLADDRIGADRESTTVSAELRAAYEELEATVDEFLFGKDPGNFSILSQALSRVRSAREEQK